jgi:hypothetical protein
MATDNSFYVGGIKITPTVTAPTPVAPTAPAATATPSYGTNFRRAEEASNAQGITTAAVQSANNVVEEARAKVEAAATPIAQAQAMIALNEAKIVAANYDLMNQEQTAAQNLAEAKANQTAAQELLAATKSDAISLAKLTGGTTTATADGRGLYVVPPTVAEKSVIGAIGATPTGKKDLILATLQQLGIPESMQQASVAFIEYAMNDGMTEVEATSLYYNNKSFTTKNGITIESPFYKEYTYLRDFAPKDGKDLPTPKELMAFKLGVKDLVAKTGRSPLFASEESLQKFISNGVKITDLDARFAEYGVAALAADPNKVATLKALGYINDSQGLIDFYADNSIGQKQFEINQKTAAFAQQALQRVSSGIKFDAANMKKLAAAAGATEAGTGLATVEATASKAFQAIGEQLLPTTAVSGIYERGAAATEAERKAMIQKELEDEQFMGMPSNRRKRLLEQNVKGFSGEAGIYNRVGVTGSLGSSSTGMV